MQVKRKPRWRRYAGWFLAILVVIGLIVVPTNYYVEVPGGADALSKFVHVKGVRDKDKGSYRLMTVGVVGPASPAMLLWGHFQPFSDIVSKKDLMGGSSSAEYDELQNYYIKSAANAATVAAFKAAGKPVKIRYQGILVMSITKDSKFADVLQLGDTITAINGVHYTKAQDYINAIKKYKAGTTVRVTFTRAGKTHTVSRPLVHLEGTKRAGLGITLTDHTSVQSTPQVKIDAGSIGGPSAGLMFALETYDQISGQNLRHGRTVAGTGTIDEKGVVGVIGGIDKKVYAASQAGATIFFAPDVPATKAIKRLDPSYVNNYDEATQAARKMKTTMKIVPVRRLQDAIDYLNGK